MNKIINIKYYISKKNMEKKLKLIKKFYICESNASCLCFECKEYCCASCFKLVHDKKKNQIINGKIRYICSNLSLLPISSR